jgi:hypothetical protein
MLSKPQLHFAFHHVQAITLGAVSAQPEVFNCLVFRVSAFCGEAKEPASIKAHQRFGALRIGTLGDHESVAAANVLEVNFRLYVARNRKLSVSSN